MPNIKPQEFNNYVTSLLEKYNKDTVQRIVDNDVEAMGKEAQTELKGYSKKGVQLYVTGEYQRGWSTLKRKDKNGLRRVTVRNRNKAPLVHLLEFGHGGPFPAKPYPHVRDTELTYQRKLYEKLRRELG